MRTSQCQAEHIFRTEGDGGLGAMGRAFAVVLVVAR